MREIQSELGFERFVEVLFFDDEPRNYKPTADLGVCPFLVNQVDGLNMNSMIDGLTRFSKKSKKQ